VSQPYKAWTDIVRNYLHLRGASLQSIAGPYAAQVAKIVPGAAGGAEGSGSVGPSNPEEERFHLFEGLTQFFVHISQEKPLVIFLDDLQWASSIELVHHLSRNFGNQRVVMLSSYRDDDLKQNSKLWNTLMAMSKERLFHSLPLRALDEENVGRLMSNAAKGSITPQLLAAIYKRTEGNPFFVEEVVRFLRERDEIVQTEVGWDMRESGSLVTPESVKMVITERMEQLGQDAEEALRIASMIGREFSLRLLGELMGREEDAIVKVLDRCEAAGVVVSRQVLGEETYNFTHDLLQEALYEGIGPAQRRRHHLRTGQAMEKLYATRLEDRYDSLAHHFLEGNDLQKTVQYGELAARRAIDVHAYGKAVNLLEQVLEAQTVVNPNDRAKRCDLLLTLGSALGPAGEPKRVGDTITPEALGLAEQLNDHQRASECCQMALEGMYRYGGAPITRSPAWRLWAERASHYAVKGTRQQVIADLALARVYIAQRRWSERRKLIDRASELARKLNDPEVLFRTMSEQITAGNGIQHNPGRISIAKEMVRASRDRVSTQTLLFFLRVSQTNFLAAGERSRAEEVWHELDELASRTHDASALYWPLLLEALRANLDGDLEQAAAAKTRIINRADELGISSEGRLYAQLLSFRPLLYLGRAEETLADLPEAEQLAGAQAFSSTVRFGWSALCLAHLGRLAEAQEQLYGYLGQLNLLPEEDETPMAILVTLLEIAVLVEHREATSILVKRLSGTVGLGNSGMFFVNVGRNLGKAEVLLGDRTAARANYERSLDWATKIRYRPEVALTRFELAKLLLSEAEAATGSHSAAALRSEAQAHLDFAMGEFRAMKMQPALEQALRQKDLLTT